MKLQEQKYLNELVTDKLLVNLKLLTHHDRNFHGILLHWTISGRNKLANTKII